MNPPAYTPSRKLPAAQRRLAVFLFAVTIAAAGPALADNKPRNSNNNHRNDPRPKVNIPVIDPKPAHNAQEALVKERATLMQAETTFNALVGQLVKQFEASGEMASALEEQRAVQAAYQAAAGPVRAAVEARSDYQQALAAKVKAEKDLAALREASAPPDQMTPAAQEVLERGSAAARLEAAALAADPAAQSAWQRVASAGARVAALRARFDASLRDNSQWSAAKKARDEARATVAKDEAAWAAALQKLADQKVAHDKARAEQDRLDREWYARHPNARRE